MRGSQGRLVKGLEMKILLVLDRLLGGLGCGALVVPCLRLVALLKAAVALGAVLAVEG